MNLYFILYSTRLNPLNYRYIAKMSYHILKSLSICPSSNTEYCLILQYEIGILRNNDSDFF